MQAVIRNTQMKDCACVTKLYFPTINHIGKSFASSTLNYSNLSILLSSSHTSIFTYSSTFNSVWEVNIRSENTPQRYAKLRKVNIAFKLRGSNRMGSRSIVCSGWGRKGSGRKHEGLRKSPGVFGLRTAESYQSLYIFSIINKAAFMHSSFGLFWKNIHIYPKAAHCLFRCLCCDLRWLWRTEFIWEWESDCRTHGKPSRTTGNTGGSQGSRVF